MRTELRQILDFTPDCGSLVKQTNIKKSDVSSNCSESGTFYHVSSDF
jgi:hypothetical protein